MQSLPEVQSGVQSLPEVVLGLVLDFVGLNASAAACCPCWLAAYRAHLTSVHFSSAIAARVTNADLARLAGAGFGAVTSLRLHHGIALTDVGLACLFAPPGEGGAAAPPPSPRFAATLTRVDLTSTFGATDATLKAVSNACGALRSLVVSGCGKMSDSGLRHLAAGPAARDGVLRALHLASFNHSWDFFGDRGMRFVARGVGALTELDVSGNHGLTARGVGALAGLRELERLRARGCEQASAEWCELLAAGAPALRELDLRKNLHLGARDARAPFLAAGRAALVVVLVDDADETDDGATVGDSARGFEDRVFGAMPREARIFGNVQSRVTYAGVDGDVLATHQQYGGRPDKAGCYK